MAANVSLSSLSSGRRTLVELMCRLHYGQVLGMHVKGGDPVFHPTPRLVRAFRLGLGSVPHPTAPRQDYLLKNQVLDLLRYLDHVRDGTIDCIEVRDGLPYRVRHAEPFA